MEGACSNSYPRVVKFSKKYNHVSPTIIYCKIVILLNDKWSPLNHGEDFSNYDKTEFYGTSLFFSFYIQNCSRKT